MFYGEYIYGPLIYCWEILQYFRFPVNLTDYNRRGKGGCDTKIFSV